MADDKLLSAVLVEFARTMVTDFPIQAMLDGLVSHIVGVLPIAAAGLSLISPGSQPRYVAASDESALCFEKLQTDLDEGPCLVAYRTGRAVTVPDLREDTQFPRFGPRALEAGLLAVFTFPLRQGDSQLGALDLYRGSAGPLDAETMAAAQTLADVAAAYLLNAQARADLRNAAEAARQTALHDPLTGLPNRALLFERVAHAIARSRRSNKKMALLFADLDQFKAVNDAHGHHVGDELLIAVAARLTQLIRASDTVCRLSGDEFVILCEDLDDVADAETIATHIGAGLEPAFDVSYARVQVTASVGVAFSGGDDVVPEQILSDADLAMYHAKRRGGGRHHVIDSSERSQASERRSLQHDMRGAAARGELRTEYQPIVRTADGQITGAEALLRWAHPSRGMVAPQVLIPLAEQNGLIPELGEWVLNSACRDRLRWDVDPDHDFGISVNVSGQQFISPAFAAIVGEALTASGTAGQRLTLEITPSAILEDGDRALLALQDLKRLDVVIALDGFGSGFSSLSHLKRFPIDVVKIDRDFIGDIGRDREIHAIVASIVSLAHVLDMTVVAEGVETAEQHRAITDLGCDSCQGFYFDRPMPADHLDVVMQGARTR